MYRRYLQFLLRPRLTRIRSKRHSVQMKPRPPLAEQRSNYWKAVVACVWMLMSATLAEPRSPPPMTVIEPTATIQELMEDEIDPSADFIWDSVGIITTSAGTEQKRPRTDDDWKTLRRHAIVLIEASNLLLMQGRRVAAVDFPSAGPGVLSSQDIQTHLQHNRSQFIAFAQALRATGRGVLAAIESKDSAELLKLGEQLDDACEACHVANWYPHQIIPSLPAEPEVIH
jgi:hypothetical protein